MMLKSADVVGLLLYQFVTIALPTIRRRHLIILIRSTGSARGRNTMGRSALNSERVFAWAFKHFAGTLGRTVSFVHDILIRIPFLHKRGRCGGPPTQHGTVFWLGEFIHIIRPR